MATKGIENPIVIDKKGGVKVVEGDGYIRSLLRTALGSGESNNPFQDIGLGEFMIFDIDGQEIQDLILGKINDIFDEFRELELADLAVTDDNLKFSKNTNGQIELDLHYINLETDEIREFSHKIASV